MDCACGFPRDATYNDTIYNLVVVIERDVAGDPETGAETGVQTDYVDVYACQEHTRPSAHVPRGWKVRRWTRRRLRPGEGRTEHVRSALDVQRMAETRRPDHP